MGRYEGHCYLWTEDIGKRGANEIASFVMNFIEMKSEQGVKIFIFYSDNCTGRNRFVFAMYALAASKYDVKIIHRFLEKGHTQNEGDSLHACIEKKVLGERFTFQISGKRLWRQQNERASHTS